jgi:CubicO group peptidase (beta-lactamase class C family)
MKDTGIDLDTSRRVRIATPHDAAMNPVPLWDWGVLAGAGAMRSTIADLLVFAAANMGLIDSPLQAAMQRMRSFRRPGEVPTTGQALGWSVIKAAPREILFQNGGTGGFRAALAIDIANRRAAVVWANSPLEVDLVAIHAVDPRAPLPDRKLGN